MRWSTIFAVLILIPSAAAQTGSGEWEMELSSGPDAPIRPDVGVGNVTLQVTVPCGEVMRSEPGQSPAVAFKAPQTSSSEVFITGPQKVGLDTEQCASPFDDLIQNVTFQIAATTQAPGEQALMATFDAELVDLGTLASPQPRRQVDVPFSIAYYGLIQMESEDRMATEAGSKVTVTVESFGNARTEVRFELVEEPASRVVLPDPIFLESPTTGLSGTRMTVNVSVDPASGEETFTLRAIPMSAKSGTPGENSAEVNLLARDKGIPAPSPVLWLVGLAAAMWARRR